jgi:DUF4097 and DUF4098 domain-containing protein YvlB
MFRIEPGALRRLPGLAAFSGCLLAGAVQAEDFERSFEFKGDRLEVASLIGAVTVEASEGAAFRVVVEVHGADATPERITFDQGTDRLAVKFPIDEHTKYVYPALGRGSRTMWSIEKRHRENDWFDRLLAVATGKRIEVRGRDFGGAVEMWADVRIHVPRDAELVAHVGAGSMTARAVRGDLTLKVRSGEVLAEDIEGSLFADTGSGEVTVTRVRGDVTADTGSGSVDVQNVSDAKDVVIDTGSGSVAAADIKCMALLVDTGSGDVDLAEIDVRTLKVDTGSGGVDAHGIAADEATIDTGSGSVDLDLDRMGKGRFHVDTGSGGIRVNLPDQASADFEIDTGSGGVTTDIDGVSLGKRDRNHARFTVGGGDADVTLSTGSGGVRVTQGRGAASRR